jgi:hypothetical protein
MSGPASPNAGIHTFQKTPRERVVISRGTYRGRPYVSVWVHWLTPAGAWAPTKKGLTLRADLLPDLEEGLRLAHAIGSPSGASTT